MMISPEAYYEMNLKGKTADQIMSTIRGLKQEIGRLKNTMEHPDYGSEPIMHPSEATRLSCTRDYLNRAKLALAEAGVVYKSSQAELKAQEFENNFPFISKIIFSIGGYFGGHQTRTVCIEGEELHCYTQQSPGPYSDEPECEFLLPMEKDEFMDELSRLYIGEWRRSYQTERFGYVVLDGTQWELEIQFSNGAKPFKSYGSNSYPYNFDDFQELLGIDATEEDEYGPRFEILTRYLNQLDDDNIGTWIIDWENDGSPEHPIQFPFVNYSRLVDNFIDDVMRVVDQNEEMQLTHYGKILESNGIEWSSKSMSEADVSGADVTCVLALLVGAIRAERFCDGALLGFFKDGSIRKWLERLQEIDSVEEA